MINPTTLTVKPGQYIKEQSFNLTLKTPDASTTLLLNKSTISAMITGTYGWWPSFSGIGNLIAIAWQTLVSVTGRMDVVAAFSDTIVMSANNPTFGYPYTVFVDAARDPARPVQAERYNYYVGESHDYVDAKGRTFRVTRHYDSNVGKEFTVEVCA